MASALAAAFALAVAAAPVLRVVELEDGRARAGGPVFLRAGEARTLAAVVSDGEHCASPDGVPVEGQACGRLSASVQRSLRWFLAVAEPLDYDNAATCGLEAVRHGCHQPLHWRREALPALDGQAVLAVQDVPALATLGTHRLGVELVPEARQSPGGRGTLGSAEAEGLLQVVVRRDDTYVGFLTEQLGTPFVHVPARLPGRGHQTDERLGADCVALVIYGQRRLGRRVPYVAPAALHRYTAPVGDGAVRPGDILHFGFQTAVLSRDVPPMGKLDAGDLVLHTFHGVAEEVPFGQLPYRHLPRTLLRWRDTGDASPRAARGDESPAPAAF